MPDADPLAPLLRLEGVPSAFAATRDGIDALLRDRGLRRTSSDQTAEALLVGAHASAVLEGSSSSLESVRAGSGDAVAADAVRVSVHLLSLVPTLRTSPLQAFARLHALASGDAESGRPRDAASLDRLQTLGRLLDGTTAAPALLVAAVVHADLATAAPVPLPQRDRGARRRAAGVGGARRRRAVGAGAGSRPPGAAGGVRVEPARVPRRWSRRRGCLAEVRGGGGGQGCRGESAGTW